MFLIFVGGAPSRRKGFDFHWVKKKRIAAGAPPTKNLSFHLPDILSLYSCIQPDR